jgi:hypothetical protein
MAPTMPTVEQQQRTILVVDDDPAILNFVSRLLVDADYHVLTASNGAAALQQSKNQEGGIDLLLSSTCQETVTTANDTGQPVIRIEPGNPQVIYLPNYDPAHIWGPSLYYPYASWFYPRDTTVSVWGSTRSRARLAPPNRRADWTPTLHWEVESAKAAGQPVAVLSHRW